jgi:uncharacterized protein (TIGR02466 family)
MSTLQSRPIWPANFFFRQWDDHPRESPAIIQHLCELKSQEHDPVASGVARDSKSTGLFESRFNLFHTRHTGLVKLIAFINDSLCQAVSQLNGGVDPRLVDVIVTESWFHITNNGGFHDNHAHEQCSWCGIYYLQSGDPPSPQSGGARNGINRFYAPLSMGGRYCDFGNEYLRRTNNFDVTPEDGWLILFPSYLQHSALAYRGRKDRVVIAFNCQVQRAPQPRH